MLNHSFEINELKLTKMTRHVAQVAGMLELINNYGGIEGAKDRFLSVSDVVEDAAKAQKSWTNAWREFEHTLEATKKTAMAFMDGPGQLLLKLATGGINMFVGADKLITDNFNAEGATAFSTLIGSTLIGGTGWGIGKTLLEGKRQKDYYQSIFSEVQNIVKNMSPKDINNVDFGNIVGEAIFNIGKKSDDANKKVGKLKQTLISFKDLKFKEGFSTFFSIPTVQLLAISAVIAGIMYLYKKQERQHYEFLEAIKDAKTELADFQALQGSDNYISKTEKMMIRQINTWVQFKSAIEDAGVAFKDTMDKIADIKPIKKPLGIIPDPTTGLTETHKAGIIEKIKTDNDFVKDFTFIYGKDIEKFVSENPDINKNIPKNTDVTQYQLTEFINSDQFNLEELKKTSEGLKYETARLSSASSILNTIREEDDYKVQLALISYLKNQETGGTLYSKLKNEQISKYNESLSKIKNDELNITDEDRKVIVQAVYGVNTDYTGLGVNNTDAKITISKDIDKNNKIIDKGRIDVGTRDIGGFEYLEEKLKELEKKEKIQEKKVEKVKENKWSKKLEKSKDNELEL